LKAFEAELAALRPRLDRLARDRMMFAAGRQAEKRGQKTVLTPFSRWAWPAAFAAASTVAAVLALILVVAPPTRVVERPVPAPPQPAPGGLAVDQQPGNRTAEAPRQEPTHAARRAEELPRFRRMQAELVERILADKPDLSPSPQAEAVRHAPRRHEPVSYRELRESLLDDPTLGQAAMVRPARQPSLSSGVGS